MGNDMRAKISTVMGLCCAASLVAGQVVASAGGDESSRSQAQMLSGWSSSMQKAGESAKKKKVVEEIGGSRGAVKVVVGPQNSSKGKGSIVRQKSESKEKRGEPVEKKGKKESGDAKSIKGNKKKFQKLRKTGFGDLTKAGKSAKKTKRLLLQYKEGEVGSSAARQSDIGAASNYFEWSYYDGVQANDTTEILEVVLVVPTDEPETLFGWIEVAGAYESDEGTLTFGSDTPGLLMDTTGDKTANFGFTSGGYMSYDTLYRLSLGRFEAGGGITDTGYDAVIYRDYDYYGFWIENWRAAGLGLMAPMFGLKDFYFGTWDFAPETYPSLLNIGAQVPAPAPPATPAPAPTTPAPAPASKPGAVTRLGGKKKSSSKMLLKWKAPSSDGGATITKYGTCISTKKKCKNWKMQSASKKKKVFKKLKPGKKYIAQVRAKNSVGQGPITKLAFKLK